MGRHADPDQRHFYGSLLAALLRGLMAVALAVGLYFVLASFRPGRDPGPVVMNDAAGSLDPSASPATPPAPVSGEPAAPVEPTTLTAPDPPAPDPAEAVPDEALAQAPPPSQTTIQVLDGVGDDVRARAAAQVLRDLGYQVVVINPAGVDYATTTVLFTRGHEVEARALLARDGRFASIRPNPNLSESVDLHVVVGRDWPR